MPTNQELVRRGLRHFATCVHCDQPIIITVTPKPLYHRFTGCLSCNPVDNGDGTFSEPADLWTGRRAAS